MLLLFLLYCWCWEFLYSDSIKNNIYLFLLVNIFDNWASKNEILNAKLLLVETLLELQEALECLVVVIGGLICDFSCKFLATVDVLHWLGSSLLLIIGKSIDALGIDPANFHTISCKLGISEQNVSRADISIIQTDQVSRLLINRLGD